MGEWLLGWVRLVVSRAALSQNSPREVAADLAQGMGGKGRRGGGWSEVDVWEDHWKVPVGCPSRNSPGEEEGMSVRGWMVRRPGCRCRGQKDERIVLIPLSQNFPGGARGFVEGSAV